MPPILFWIFSILMLGFALAVVVNRNPVASALSLVISFLGLAALFVSLDAYFIGTIQVLVYAGAVMVLFLFIIMLLDLKAERRRKLNWMVTLGGSIVSLGFVCQLVGVLHRFPAGNKELPALAGKIDDVRAIGTILFTHYNMPFQVIDILLLVATVGVVVLSKKELK